MFTTQGTHKQRDASSNGDFKGGINQWGCLTSGVNGWWPGKPVVVLTACFACVMLTWPWDQWKIPKFEVVWLVVDLLCLPRVFCRVLALAVCQPLAVVLGLIRVVQFHGSPSLFILRTTLLTPRTPLNREGALVLRLRAGSRQKLDYMGVVLKPMQDL